MSIRCEDIVAALATGGPIRRWQARRHAAGCPQCAAARRDLEHLAGALAERSPLTAAERRLWMTAALEPASPEPLRAWWTRPALAWAPFLVVLATLAAWSAFRPAVRQSDVPATATGVRPTVKPEPLPDVESLRGGVVTLVQELDDLRRRAELLDARKDVDALLAQFAPRAVSDGL